MTAKEQKSGSSHLTDHPVCSSSIWSNLHLATMDSSRPEPYGTIEHGAMVIKDEQLAWIGREADLPEEYRCSDEFSRCNGEGMWVTPGLIDCHTHIVYGGNRAEEFEQRLQGISYEEIANRGGGIRSTVKATRAASEEELYSAAEKRLQYFLNEGVTGIEIKSGYGLDSDTELKMLRVARRLGELHSVDVSTSYLGAHALPPEYTNSGDYIHWVCAEMLPKVSRLKLADAVDIFCESIGFNLLETEKVFRTARELNIPIKAHVEQLSNMGGSALAAEYGALSVDHLEYLDQAGIDAMKSSGSVAVLLPGAFYFLRETQCPPIDKLRAQGIPMAIASDCNPGSSPATSLLLMMNMACTFFRFTPEEALAGVTCHASRALGWHEKTGVLKPGKLASFVLWDIQHPAELSYAIGFNPCVKVVKNGQIVLAKIIQPTQK